jgi:hypothetical protein
MFSYDYYADLHAPGPAAVVIFLSIFFTQRYRKE